MRDSGNSTWVLLACCCMVAALAAAPAFAASEDHRGEFGILVGVGTADSVLVGPDKDDNPNPILGLRLGHRVGERVNWFLDGTFGGFEAASFPFTTDVKTARTGFEALLRPEARWQWVVQFGAGWMGVKNSNRSISTDRAMASLGFGQRRPGEQGTFHWILRADRSLTDNGLGGEDLMNYQALMGYSWGFGGPARDTDGDGVPDRRDRCPDTPTGAMVDERGCPKDSDGDGVADGADGCPDTPRGAKVDDRGCPKDTDGDGVYDGLDQCPNTPKGARVDARGCPQDSDGDGVADGVDQCPNTPKGAGVDDRGCPRDTDGDGVYDGLDQCPNTPKGTEVDARGCPKAKRLFEEEQKTLILKGVTFELNSANLTPEARRVLDEVAASLLAFPDVRVEIAGHTDSTGSAAYNLQLSQRRAEAVKAYLVGKGVDAGRLVARGYGETQPIADNRTAEGRAKNRRVELRRLD